MKRRVWSIYRISDGVFVKTLSASATIGDVDHFVARNTPEGCSVVEGSYSQVAAKLENGKVIFQESSMALHEAMTAPALRRIAKSASPSEPSPLEPATPSPE